MLQGLQALRLFAALSIVLFHALGSRQVVPLLWLGVPVFFALSGFLMAKLMTGAGAGRFILHRALRIYPPFWLAVALWMLLIWLTQGKMPAFHPAVLTLVPSGLGPLPIYAVVWTLLFEMFFYSVVAALCLVPNETWRRVLVVAWACAILALSRDAIAPIPTAPNLLDIALHPLNLIFISGMVAWWLLPTVRRWPRLSLFLGAAAALYWSHDLIAGQPNIGGYTLVPAFLVLAFADIRLKQKSALVLGGNASYGLYLMHPSLLGAVALLVPLQGWWHWSACVLLTVVGGVAFGLLEYRCYGELRRWVNSLVDRYLAAIRAASSRRWSSERSAMTSSIVGEGAVPCVPLFSPARVLDHGGNRAADVAQIGARGPRRAERPA